MNHHFTPPTLLELNGRWNAGKKVQKKVLSSKLYLMIMRQIVA